MESLVRTAFYSGCGFYYLPKAKRKETVFLTALVRLPASAPPFHLGVVRYAFDETPAHLLDNRTKPVKDANSQLGLKTIDRIVSVSQKSGLSFPFSPFFK
ncbi:hypothetical protein [Prevotella falsenii]|uniref:hypothetical protein n=1 Tax=Prevotella falsenii TaxID=515414 RepID=UPI0012EBA266|nr:hypothetical protein [Prevotella falsenii]